MGNGISALGMRTVQHGHQAAKTHDAPKKTVGWWVKEATHTGSDISNVVLKPIYHLIDWAKMYNPNISSEWVNLSATTKDAKNVISASQVFKKMHTAGCATWDFVKQRTASAFKTTVVEASNLVNSVCDGLTVAIGRNIVALNAKTVGGVNGASLFIGSANGMHEEMDKMNKARASATKLGEKQATHAFFNFAKWVSYFVLSKLVLFSWLGGIVAPPWAFLAASTSALVFTNAAFFYGKVHDISNK